MAEQDHNLSLFEEHRLAEEQIDAECESVIVVVVACMVAVTLSEALEQNCIAQKI